jgi:hypothetical protein
MFNNVKYLSLRVKPVGISELRREEQEGLLHFLRKWEKWLDGLQS